MRRAELSYELPPELIATHPVEPRDASRLLVVDRQRGDIAHRTFRDVGEYLSAGDCLVLNNARVIPARFACRRATGGHVDGLFLGSEGGGSADGPTWRVLMTSAARLRAGEELLAIGPPGAEPAPPVRLRLIARGPRGEWTLRAVAAEDGRDLPARIGRTPLPPYIERARRSESAESTESVDRERYQTVYAAEPGAVAAPTAGLHFTRDLLDRLAAAGVKRAEVTLHVGPGTFRPIEMESLSEHPMQSETYSATRAALERIATTRRKGGRIVSVGTTSARVLESLGNLEAAAAHADALHGSTDIFIYPPYKFRNVDVLLTNFHLPESTLLALVMAFASPELIRAAYRAAIQHRYRFYSFGDAMLIV